MHADYRDYCLELVSGLGPCLAKRMFGGYGISHDGLTFALIAFEQLWLKADVQSQPEFEQAGCQRFTYDAKGKVMSMGYWSAPAEAMDSAPGMLPWARLAFAAAVRAQAAKRPTKSAVTRGAKVARPGPASKTRKLKK